MVLVYGLVVSEKGYRHMTEPSKRHCHVRPCCVGRPPLQALLRRNRIPKGVSYSDESMSTDRNRVLLLGHSGSRRNLTPLSSFPVRLG